MLAAIPYQKNHRVYLEQTGGEHCRFIFYSEFHGNWPTYTENEWAALDVATLEPLKM